MPNSIIKGSNSKCAIFILGEESSQLEDVKRKLAVRNKLLQKGEYVSLNTSVLKLANDYYTETELNNKFKKTKVRVRNNYIFPALSFLC